MIARKYPISVRKKIRCEHLGKHTAMRECIGCTGSVRVKVFDCDHPEHEETTVSECNRCPDYEPISNQPKPIEYTAPQKVTSWSVGVVTTPRKTPTLQRCLQSVREAGWDELRIFAEPDSSIPKEFRTHPVSWRSETIGSWPNWFLGLSELLLRDPNADAYMMLEDDSLFARNVRQYCENILWPEGKVGLVSLYCPMHYLKRQRQLHVVDQGWDLWGAVAYVFPNAAAHLLLASPVTVGYRKNGPNEGLKSIDCIVGLWARQAGLKVYYHSPSLVQHIGDTSTLWKGSINWGRRRAPDFVGDGFDCLRLLERST